MPSPFKNTADLGKFLIKERLVTKPEFDNALASAGRGAGIEAVLEKLELQGALTGYQSGRIRKGDTEGLVLGHYKLLYRNAAGSFARVYRGVDLRSGQMVGVKVLRGKHAADPEAVKDFIREAEMCQPLRHENIVPIYEVGQHGDFRYFTMEFVEGGNLRDFLNIRKKLSHKEATKCILDVALGLQYALDKGVTHRDLKLTNVLMSIKGVAKLVDFGLGGGPDVTTDNDTLARAIEYATVERGTNAPRHDPRTDLYFLGVMYYELLTGVGPYERTKERSERGAFSRYENVQPIFEVDPSLHASIVKVVEKLMRLDPDERYQTPGAAAADLQAVLRILDDPNFSPPEIATHSASAGNGAASAPVEPPPVKPLVPAQPMVVFVESRHKQQEMLREYFTRHKFRVLIMADVNRGLNRLEMNPPPSAIVFMAESVGKDAVDGYIRAQKFQKLGIRVLLVLPEKKPHWGEGLKQTEQFKVTIQPVTLRDLRKAIAPGSAGENESGD